MQQRRRWMSVRMSLRLGRRRFLLTFPPHWNNWALILTACLLVPPCYFLSAVPTVMALRKSGLMTPAVERCVIIFYAPLVWLEQNSPLIRDVLTAESRLIQTIVGK